MPWFRPADWSITTRISLSVGLLVMLLSSAGGWLLIRFEIELIRTYQQEYRAKLEASIQARAEESHAALRHNVQFNASILAEVVALHLYNVDNAEMKKALLPFMRYAEIQGVQILDDNGKVFAVAWKMPDQSIQAGDAWPASVTAAPSTSLNTPVLRNGQALGQLQVLYTDALLHEKTQKIREQALQEAADFHAQVRTQLRQGILTQAVSLAVMLLVLLLLLFVLLRIFVHKPLLRLSNLAAQLATLDLSVDVPPTQRHDEVGRLNQSLGRVVQVFREVLRQVQQSSMQVAGAATQLSASAKQQQMVVGTQATVSREVCYSAQEISHVTDALATAMREVAQASQQTATLANRSQADLGRMEIAMQHMETASRAVSTRLTAIHEQAANINQIITTITRVADQTNLLSLNAAIESEKAGEFGRGFAVVAQEIRRLADQTAVAALDIDEMVKNMQTAVGGGVTETRNFIDAVTESVEDVKKVSAQLTQIIQQVQALSPSFEQVGQGVAQQSDNAQRINGSIQGLSEDMQQTAASLSQSFLAISQLHEAATSLQRELAQFRLDK